MNLFRDENSTCAQVFGHLTDAEFTAQEAAEYLEVSIATLRRYVHGGKLRPCKVVGRNQLFAAYELRALKRSLRNVKG